MTRSLLPLIALTVLLAGCETVADSARRGAERGAEQATERQAERAASAAIDRAAASASTAIPANAGPSRGADCSALLPDAEVIRVCQLTSVLADESSSDAGCSRTFFRSENDPDTGLMLRVGDQESASTARLTVQLQSADPGGRTVRVGDGGFASTIEAVGTGYLKHSVTFSSGASLVVLDATQLDTSRPALCTLDQMVTLAETVASGL